jgi:glycerol-3-phosphate acyltransferase PlsX
MVFLILAKPSHPILSIHEFPSPFTLELPRMKLVLDAMGGDFAPEETVAGAVEYAREFDHTVILVGDAEAIRQELEKHETEGLGLTVVHASDPVHMDEEPAMAVRRKKNNPMVVGMRLVKEGEADAFCSVGNTGAVLTAGHMVFRRIRGVHRAVLTTPFPNYQGFHVFGDVGANTDCRPEWLVQWAHMLSIYAEALLEIESPRVAFLSNGEESGKGNQLIKTAQTLMARRNHLNYIGVVEPKEMMGGAADVVITDGFTGNILVKQSEAVANFIFRILKEEILARPRGKIGAALARPAFRATMDRLGDKEYGAGLLLGLNGLVTIGHGRSKREDIYFALKTTARLVEADVLEKTRHKIESLLALQQSHLQGESS